jgi:FkbM family methyltransferase
MFKVRQEGDLWFRIARTLRRYASSRRTRQVVCRFIVSTFYSKSDDKVISLYGPYLIPLWNDHSFEMALTGGFDFGLQEILQQPREGQPAFLDIGANLGIFSLIAGRNPSFSQIHSVEPNAEVCGYLIRNAEANGLALKAHNVGISDREGTAKFFVSSAKSGRGNLRGAGRDSIEIQVRDSRFFDELKTQIGDIPVFVKIDVEGHEAVVMEQLGKSSLASNVAELFVEVTPRWAGEGGARKVIEEAERLGLEEASRFGRDNMQYDIYFRKAPDRSGQTAGPVLR